MKEHWLQWALKEGVASGVGGARPCAAACSGGWRGPTPSCVAWAGTSSPMAMLQCCMACTYSELGRQKLEAFRASPRSGRAACWLPAREAVWSEVILHCPLGDGLEGGGGSSHLLPTQPGYLSSWHRHHHHQQQQQPS